MAGDENENESSGTALARTDLYEGTTSLATRETASTAIAAAVQAQIQARWVLAVKRPRVIDAVRTSLLKECQRTGFAERAWFKKPQGKKQDDNGRWVENFAEGLSIRFAEAAVQRMGNLATTSQVIYDDDEKRIVLCQAIDYETNASWDQQVVISKTVERRFLKKGQRPLSTRINSFGDPVYKLEATEDEVEMATARRVSMVLRNLALRLVPADVLDDCKAEIHRTLEADVRKDPNAARKRLVDSFAEVGVTAVMLVEYLGGRQLENLTPAETLELRALFAAIRDREVGWAEVLEASPHRAAPTAPGATPDPKAAATREKLGRKAEELRKKAAGGAAAPRGGAKDAPAPARGGETPAPTPPSSSSGQPAPASGRAPDPSAGEVPPDQEPREPGSDG